MKRPFWVSAIAFLLLPMISCTASPRFVNNPRPEVSVDFSAFANAGCPPDGNGLMLCGSDSPLAAFSCDRIEEPDGLLGGLTPAYPIAYCLYDSYPHTGEDYERTLQVESDGYIYQTGGIA